MERRFRLLTSVVAAVLLAGCGKDSNPVDAGNTNGTAKPTDPGTPDGTPVTQSLGPAGGSVSSSDGKFTLTLPAGALAAATDVTVQPITNTAWGGIGQGYRLSPDGLQFTTPVDVVFSVTNEALAVTSPELLDVAVQDHEGKWGVLRNKTLDGAAHTLTAKTSHFSDYSMISGVQIVPATATVQTGHTLELNVLFCDREAISDGADELASLLITCDAELAPLGTFTNWSVNGVAGGGAAIGTVAPGTGHVVTYTAPGSLPSQNPVAVSVHTNYNGMSAQLVSNVTVTSGERWVGTCSAVLPTGQVEVTNLVWEFVYFDGSARHFKPSGTVNQTELIYPGCTVISYAPHEQPIAAEDGGLDVFYQTDPPNFSGGGGTYWSGNVCVLCPPNPEVTCVDGATTGGAWFSGTGNVTNNGNTIAGTTTNVFGTFTFSFTRQP